MYKKLDTPIVYKYARIPSLWLRVPFIVFFSLTTAYECHGSWEENGIGGFLIASPLSRSSTSARRYCFSYSETEEGLQVFSSSDSCLRDGSPNLEGIWAFNLTVDGKLKRKHEQNLFLLFSLSTSPLPLLSVDYLKTNRLNLHVFYICSHFAFAYIVSWKASVVAAHWIRRKQ